MIHHFNGLGNQEYPPLQNLAQIYVDSNYPVIQVFSIQLFVEQVVDFKAIEMQVYFCMQNRLVIDAGSYYLRMAI